MSAYDEQAERELEQHRAWTAHVEREREREQYLAWVAQIQRERVNLELHHAWMAQMHRALARDLMTSVDCDAIERRIYPDGAPTTEHKEKP